MGEEWKIKVCRLLLKYVAPFDKYARYCPKFLLKVSLIVVSISDQRSLLLYGNALKESEKLMSPSVPIF